VDLGLKNKTALVTGASKGLGFAAAMRLAKEGCRVLISSRSESNLLAAKEKIKNETGQTVLTFTANVSKKKEVELLFDFVKKEMDTLDILLSNAGGPKPGKFDSFDDEDWYEAMEVSLMSTVRLFRAGIAMMKAKGQGGKLLVITTSGAKQPQENLLLSNTFRAGVHAMVKTLSKEVAALGITVNAVVPGKFMTDRQMSVVNALSKRANISTEQAIAKRLEQVPLGRMGEPAELANYIAFLSSPMADYISGTALNIDGGYLGSI